MDSTHVVQHLENIKRELGEESYRAEVRRLARQAIKMGGQHEVFWRDIIKDFDWVNADDLKAEPDPIKQFGGMPDTQRLLIESMRQTMPGLKTQAQFNAFIGAFDAFRVVMNAIFESDKAKEMEGRKALDLGFKAAEQTTELSNKLRDVPEAATSKAAEEFKKAPDEFGEYDVQRQLLVELATLGSVDDLQAWYGRTKEQRDKVKSQTLRNALMDAIRDRKLSLEREVQAEA